MIPRWEISGWISSRGYHCCDQRAGFSPFPGQWVWLHPCRPVLVWFNCSFFLFHLFLSYPWFTTTGPLALLLSNRAQVFMLAVPSFPPLFPCLWFLQLYGSLTALSLIEILFTKVDNLTKHCFFNPLVLIPHFQRYHLSLKSYGCHSLVSKETLHVTTPSTVSGMDVLPKTRGSRTKTVWNSTVANGLWSH